ncbi:MAG: tetratricopeptide repeat protein [Planctomycetia bacterium]|nr:tetratricopeptide repeat protein [Planctomycetia bacterium]
MQRPPTITLNSTPVPVTTEELQREAELTARELIARYPTFPGALHVAAMAHSQFRRTAEAEQLWKRCIELAPQNEDYYVNLAAVAMDRGNNEFAVTTLVRAKTLGKPSPDLLHHLAVALMELGRFPEAESTAQEALAERPDSGPLKLVLGQIQLKLGKHQEAEESLREALAFGSGGPSVYFALGNACVRQGKRAEADEFLKRYQELKTSRPLDRQNRVEILSKEEAYRTATVVLTEAATVHFMQRDNLEAERLLLRAIAINPSNVPSYSALAALYQSARMLAEERVVRARLTEVAPHEFGYFVELARVCSQLGEPEAAESALKAAISVTPQDSSAFAMLADFHLATGRPDKARWYAQEAIRREPTPEGYMLLASTCKALGDDETAESAFQMARKLQGNTQGPSKKVE